MVNGANSHGYGRTRIDGPKVGQVHGSPIVNGTEQNRAKRLSLCKYSFVASTKSQCCSLYVDRQVTAFTKPFSFVFLLILALHFTDTISRLVDKAVEEEC